jgi:hypothetical protein
MIQTLVKRNLKILNVATRTYFYVESFDYQILLFSRKKCLKIVKNYIFSCEICFTAVMVYLIRGFGIDVNPKTSNYIFSMF